MTITASASTTISADAQTILEFVLDLERYADVDAKIVRVGAVEDPDADGRGSVRLWGRLRGTPPAPDKQDFELTRWERLEFTGAPKQPARLVFDFTGSFVCVPTDDGTEVTHAYEFDFKGPFRILGLGLEPWLQAKLDDELMALRSALSS